MSGIDVRGRRRFRDSDATERLSALLREEHTGADPAPTGHVHGAPAEPDAVTPEAEESPHGSVHQPWDDPESVHASRHREDVTVRRRLSRPALVLLCLVLLVALVAGAVSLLRGGGGGDAVVTSAEASSDADDGRGSGSGRGTAGASHGRSEGAGARDGGASSGVPPAESGAGVSRTPSPAGAAPGGVLTVHVVGEVKDPSVVTLSPGSRVMDAVTAAGGFTPAAVKDRINLAATVTDGAQIVIPNAQNADRVLTAPAPSGGTGASGTKAGSRATGGDGTGSAGVGAAAGGASGGTGAAPGGIPAPGGALVNLNTATETELEELPRVGPVLAQRIVEFRTQHGPFTAPEQLDDVSGVGPAMLEALLPLVTV